MSKLVLFIIWSWSVWRHWFISGGKGQNVSDTNLKEVIHILLPFRNAATRLEQDKISPRPWCSSTWHSWNSISLPAKNFIIPSDKVEVTCTSILSAKHKNVYCTKSKLSTGCSFYRPECFPRNNQKEVYKTTTVWSEAHQLKTSGSNNMVPEATSLRSF